MHTVFWLANLKGRRDHAEDIGVGEWIIILERILGK
jgi:hypothetical protein